VRVTFGKLPASWQAPKPVRASPTRLGSKPAERGPDQDAWLYEVWRCRAPGHVACFAYTHRLAGDLVAELARQPHGETCRCWMHAILRECARRGELT
jgi:hypothetical protein